MNKDIKAKWLEALRSGEYKQTTGYLNTQGEHCCLGVLCELAVEAGVTEKMYTETGTSIFDHDTSVLPQSVQTWAELEWGVPEVAYSGRMVGLADLNDGWTHPETGELVALTFDKIADMIEAQL